jgi:hypothetical protein
MIKIIGSILYNTDLVQEMGFDTNDHSPSDFEYVTETLYRNFEGGYFLCCIGSNMCKSAGPAGNSIGNERSNIVPLTFSAAREWADELLSLSEMRDSFRTPDRVQHSNAL